MKVKVNVNNLDLNINVRKVGKGSTSILMVHGIPTNARLWRHVQELLGDRYTCYAMDMVGYGESDMPLDQFEHTLNNQAEVVRAVIEKLGLKGKVILAGHDHGGGTVQIVASKYCSHIKRLILINPVSFDYWPVLEVEGFNGLVGASDEVLAGALQQAAAGFAGLLRTGSHDKIAFTDKNVKENYLRFWARGGKKLTGFKSLIKICAQPTNAETLAIDYKKITCPTLICWALHDAWMPKEAGIRIKKELKGPTRLQFIERAGHYVLEDRPDQVAWYIDDFLTEWKGI